MSFCIYTCIHTHKHTQMHMLMLTVTAKQLVVNAMESATSVADRNYGLYHDASVAASASTAPPPMIDCVALQYFPYLLSDRDRLAGKWRLHCVRAPSCMRVNAQLCQNSSSSSSLEALDVRPSQKSSSVIRSFVCSYPIDAFRVRTGSSMAD